MSSRLSNQDIILLLIPFGILFLYFATKNDTTTTTAKTQAKIGEGKEEYYLSYNKDEMYKDFLAVEGHFRNVTNSDKKGFLACCVKHLANAESHLDESISHSLIVEGEKQSENFRQLRDKVQTLRHELQAGDVTPSEGIERTREIRRDFESFNPAFNVSQCEACQIKVV